MTRFAYNVLRYVNTGLRACVSFFKRKPKQQECGPYEWANMAENTKGQPRVAGKIRLYKLTISEFMYHAAHAEDTPSES
jgi:hypothetical protein